MAKNQSEMDDLRDSIYCDIDVLLDEARKCFDEESAEWELQPILTKISVYLEVLDDMSTVDRCRRFTRLNELEAAEKARTEVTP